MRLCCGQQSICGQLARYAAHRRSRFAGAQRDERRIINTSGSWTKVWPFLQLGGIEPVVTCLRHSMMVVLPAPLWPTMSVMGVLKCSLVSLCGLKLRMPEMSIFSSVHILKSQGGGAQPYRDEARLRARELWSITFSAYVGPRATCRALDGSARGARSWPVSRPVQRAAKVQQDSLATRTSAHVDQVHLFSQTGPSWAARDCPLQKTRKHAVAMGAHCLLGAARSRISSRTVGSRRTG